MEISFIDHKQEVVSSWRLRKKEILGEELYARTSFDKVPQDIGTLLMEFLDADFKKKGDFERFINDWGLDAFWPYSEEERASIALKLYSEDISLKDYGTYNEQGYQNILNAFWITMGGEAMGIQALFDKLLYLCLDVDGPAWSRGLTSIQRYFIVETIPSLGNRLIPLDHLKKEELIYQFKIEPTPGSINEQIDLDENHLAKLIRGKELQAKDIFRSNHIAAILFAEFKEMLVGERMVRKCKYCDRYFLLSVRSDAQYCNRPIESSIAGKTCKELGPMRKYSERLADDQVTKAYRTAYKAHHVRVDWQNRHPDNPRKLTVEQWEAWKMEAREMLEKVKNGSMTLDEFKKWAKN